MRILFTRNESDLPWTATWCDHVRRWSPGGIAMAFAAVT